MFIGVNDLKGLIVNLGSFSRKTIYQWADISRSLSCAFFAEEMAPWQQLVDAAGSSSVFIEEHFFLLPCFIDLTARNLGLQPYEIAFVTASRPEIEWASQQPIGTILVSDSVEFQTIGHLADFIVDDVSEIASIVDGANRGYFGEVCATSLGDSFLSSSGMIIDFNISCADRDQVFKVFTLGRYFSTNHIKYAVHQLSHRLLKSKFDNSQNSLFSGLVLSVLDFLNREQGRIDCVIRVPPRPGSPDRLLPVVTASCLGRPYVNSSLALTCRKTYPCQIGLDSEARRLNVRDKFTVSGDVAGKNVVLFDDILTTGATVKECAMTLLQAGAAGVKILVLAVSQLEPVGNNINYELPCPEPGCDGLMGLKLNKGTPGAFFSCGNYKKGVCKRVMDFLTGWRAFNQLNGIAEGRPGNERGDK